jgi:hypothetical protein
MSLEGKNNILAKLKVKVTTESILAVIDEWKENLFGEDFAVGETEKHFRATLVKKKSSIVIQREIIRVIAKVGNSLTIQRAVEKIPLNDTATEQSQIAYEFDSWDLIYVGITAW